MSEMREDEEIWPLYINLQDVGILFFSYYLAFVNSAGAPLGACGSVSEKAARRQAEIFFPGMQELAGRTYRQAVRDRSEKAGQISIQTKTAKERGLSDLALSADAVLLGTISDVGVGEEELRDLGQTYLAVRNLFPGRKRTAPLTQEEEAELTELQRDTESEIRKFRDAGGRAAVKEKFRQRADEAGGSAQDAGSDDAGTGVHKSARQALLEDGCDNTGDRALWESTIRCLDALEGDLPEKLLAGDRSAMEKESPGELKEILEYLSTADPLVVRYFLSRCARDSAKKEEQRAAVQAAENGLKGKRAQRYVAKRAALAKKRAEESWQGPEDFYAEMDGILQEAYEKAAGEEDTLPPEDSLDWVLYFFANVRNLLPS